jgi:hypothetical protein
MELYQRPLRPGACPRSLQRPAPDRWGILSADSTRSEAVVPRGREQTVKFGRTLNPSPERPDAKFQRTFTHLSAVSPDMEWSSRFDGTRRNEPPLENPTETKDDETAQGGRMCVCREPASRVRGQLAGAHFTECCFTECHYRGPFGHRRARGGRMRSRRVARALGALSLHTLLWSDARRRLRLCL